MNTRLDILVQQPFAEDSIEAAAVAKVRRLTDATGEPVKGWWQKEETVDIGGRNVQDARWTSFELPGGGYYRVTIALPRGEDIDREYDVQEGHVHQELIEMEVSPHEHLGWQQFAGIVRAKAKPHLSRPAVSRLGLESVLEPIHEPTLLEKGMLRLEQLRENALPEAPSVFGLEFQAYKSTWQWVRAQKWKRHISSRALDWAVQSDPEYVTWVPEMPTHEQGKVLVNSLRHPGLPFLPGPSHFPRWVLFEIAGQQTLVSVPWAWWGKTPRDNTESIRFVYDRTRQNSLGEDQPGHLTLSVQDKQWFGLLEFLASGRLNQAGGMIDKVLSRENPEYALYGKVKGPLVAVAGGIILIAQSQTTEKQEWDSWLDNLANWFPGIPDGSILLGCRRAAQARNLEQLQAAFHHIRKGVKRGIPFYSASIAMMNRALAEMSDAIPDAEWLRRFIAPVAARIDPGQSFTVIRLS